MTLAPTPPALPAVRRVPELLAPAGDRDAARAAVDNGADAVYFGLRDGFNARTKAANFSTDELADLIGWLHEYGVKGYLTLNTLVFQAEWPVATRLVRAAAGAGVDAVLVQDLGLAAWMRRVCPELPLHASTQMTLASAAGIEVARRLGIRRVVLPRELSVAEIAAIAAATDVELEVFVHGALCISYSGQCQASRALGGRSGNRGECAQPCRLPYEAIVDGRPVDTAGRSRLLSPLDLAAHQHLPALAAAGVAALKIEGRMKSADYVAAATRYYRGQLDALAGGQPAAADPAGLDDLTLTFSRGFGPGWLDGPRHGALVPGEDCNHRGLRLGLVGGPRPNERVAVRLAAAVRRGDGVVFAQTDGGDQGGRVYEIFVAGRSVAAAEAGQAVELAFARGSLDLKRLFAGQAAWKTSDPQLARRLKRPRPRRAALDVRVRAAAGERLSIFARTAGGAEVEVHSDEPLESARRHPLSADVLREQLGRLGDTAWELRALEADIDGGPMAPLSVLGGLRRKMIEGLRAASRPRPWPTIDCADGETATPADGLPAAIGQSRPDRPAPPVVRVLCRGLARLDGFLTGRVVPPPAVERLLTSDAAVIADLDDPAEYAAAVDLARRFNRPIELASPRIDQAVDNKAWAAIADCRPDGVLARSLAALRYFAARGLPVAADHSLNACNAASVAWLLSLGAARVAVGYDIDAEGIADLVGSAAAAALEVVVYRRPPLFHTRHCLFSALAGNGRAADACGRPCRRRSLALRDRKGVLHPVAADAFCRNTVYAGEAEDLLALVPRLAERGVGALRAEV